MKDKNIFVSVSGGETSFYMAQLLKKEYGRTHNLLFGFANTGKERPETIDFIERCSKHFKIPVVWVEAVVHHGKRKGCTHKIIESRKDLSFNGEPFEEVIKKYGLPNVSFKHCTRELKSNPLKSLADEHFGKNNYYTAIGIRVDEIDRMASDMYKKRLIYPLVSPFPTRKPTINKFWDDMPFRLELKSYEGNCDLCFKKNLRKLLTIVEEDKSGEVVDWWRRMELKYEGHTAGREGVKPPYRFNRKNMTVDELIRLSKEGNFERSVDEKYIIDKEYKQKAISGFDLDVSNGCEESCEPFQ